MGRREQRAELQASWNVYVPREGRTPFTKKDLRAASEPVSTREAFRSGLTASPFSEAAASIPSDAAAMLPRTLIAKGTR